MPIRVEIEGKGMVAEFPDGTEPSVIDVAIKRDYFSESSSQDKTTLKEFNAGIGRGFMKAGEGLKQRTLEAAGAMGLVPPETIQSNQERLDRILKQAKESKDWTGKAGETVGETVAYSPIPGGAKGGLIRRALTGGIAGALVGALQPTETGEKWLSNAIWGGAAGGAGSGIMTALGKTINAIWKPTTKAIEGEFERAGVRASLGDVTQNPRLRKAETWLEDVPGLGLWKFRKEQGEELQAAAKRTLSEYIVNPNAPNVRQFNRDYASAMFENLNRVVKDIPEQIISPDNTRGVSLALLERYPDIFKKVQDTKTEALLRDIVYGTKEATRVSKSYSYATGTITNVEKIPKTLNWEEAWALRDGLGEMIGRARNTKSLDRTELGQLKALFSAVNKDIENWTNTIGRPEIKGLIKGANDAYKNYVVKYSIIEEAYAKASGIVGGKEVFSPKTFATELKKISRAQELGKYNLFNEKEIAELAGTANIMQYAKRAGEFMENPPTGNRWGLPTIAGGLAGYTAAMGPKGLAVAGGTVTAAALMRWLTTTESGKRFALSASKIQPDSLAMRTLMGMVYQQASKVPAVALTND